MSKNQLIKQQSGLISVTVTIVIMILVTLIVGSFALIVRREQSRTLNNQLNTQALSAAEAGIKDAQSAINAGVLTEDVNSCTGIGSFKKKAPDYNKDVSDNVQYSCVLINQHNLPDFKKDLETEDGTLVVPIDTGSGTNIDSLRISWEGSSSPDDYSSVPTDFKLPQSLNAPILRAVLFKASATLPATTFTREDMKNSAQTMFLYPKSNSSPTNFGSIAYSTGSDQKRELQGAFVSGECNSANGNNSAFTKPAAYDCNVDITGIGGGNQYFLVVKPLYKDTSFSVSAFDNSNKVLNLLNAQVEIDATGKAADVLKRVRVRVPTKTNLYFQELYGKGGLIPDATLSTTKSICKLWSFNGTAASDGCISTPTPPGGGGGGGGNGDSGFSQNTCATNPSDPDCSSGTWEGWPFTSENEISRLDRTVNNRSTNPPGIVAGCTWDWGDGTTTSNEACESGNSTDHTYPPVPANSWWTQCKYYTATLTIYFNNGYPPASYSESLAVPIKSSTPGHSNPC